MNATEVCNLPHNTLKDMGNRAYSEGRYQEAIMYYTCAIKKQANISSYYSNRALCYVQTQEYIKALSDCRRSLELDSRNLKAYFFAGQAHLGLSQWDEGLNKLMRAHDLAQEQNRNFGDEITLVIRQAKRKRFEALDEKRKQEEVALQVYLQNLILKDAKKQKSDILIAHGYSDTIDKTETSDMRSSDAAVPKNTVSASTTDSINNRLSPQPHQRRVIEPAAIVVHSSDLSPQIQSQLTQVDHDAQQRLAEVNELFAQVDSRRQKREVPDYLCGRISFELMLDPVITPSGITYDKRSILAHLRKVGHFDPISHQPLTENQLIPNRIMKEVVHAFLEENPWAESY